MFIEVSDFSFFRWALLDCKEGPIVHKGSPAEKTKILKIPLNDAFFLHSMSFTCTSVFFKISKILFELYNFYILDYTIYEYIFFYFKLYNSEIIFLNSKLYNLKCIFIV